MAALALWPLGKLEFVPAFCLALVLVMALPWLAGCASGPALRCAIATVNVPLVQRMELHDWLWKNHKVRIRGGNPSKLRLATPYFLSRADIDRFLGLFDEYRKMKGA